MSTLISSKNVGRAVTVASGTTTIDYVLADQTAFRIASEKYGPVVNDYKLTQITAPTSMLVSTDDGATWVETVYPQP